ncbi:MAG: hypothetical protein KAR20_14865, partial [Candidatus Heimdallarchaeota archaeon]|nr:hypothetical protein [Candidatus Heimdallarchaeota archaeon]
MKRFVFIIMIMSSFSLFAQEHVKIKESSNEDTKIIEKTPRQFYQRSNPPRKPPPIRIYPEKSSSELIKFGWDQFKEENYEHAAECFQELITREDSLADAYLGLGWSKLMLYRPIEETRIIKSSDYVKNREFYILKLDEFLDLYSEDDDCPTGWMNNAIKLDENGDPLHILPKENMPMYDWDWFPIVLYIDSGTDFSDQRIMKGIELNSESGIVYNFRPVWIIPDNDNYCIYNPKFGFIETFDELYSQLNGDFYKYVIGTS